MSRKSSRLPSSRHSVASKIPRQTVRNALLKLAATHKGFEGLIDSLLAAETGDALRLMASGDQHGLDAVGSAGRGPRRAMQAKRYGDTAKLDQTYLLGEMDRARAGSAA